jgi:hypothetical protein
MSKVATKNNASSVVKFDDSIILNDAGAGQENMTRDDIMIPRISILQQMSPQVNKRDGAYIEGAEPGHIYDSVAGKWFDGEMGIVVVANSYRRAHFEWKRDRGGLVADHGSDSSVLLNTQRGDRGEYLTDEGNEIVPTAEYFVFIVESGESFSPALISMSKSQMKKARQWNAMINRLMISVEGKRINPAMFWTAYKLTTVPEENDQGSWFGWNIQMMFDADSGGIIQQLPIGKEIYLAAREFRNQVAAGEVRTSPVPVDDDVM